MGLSLLLKIRDVTAIAKMYTQGSAPDAGSAWSTHHRLLLWTRPRGYHYKSAKNREIWVYMGHRGNVSSQQNKIE